MTTVRYNMDPTNVPVISKPAPSTLSSPVTKPIVHRNSNKKAAFCPPAYPGQQTKSVPYGASVKKAISKFQKNK
jgi:hypothetical protein